MKDNPTDKHASKPRTQIRRADYALTDENEIKVILRSGDYGVLATTNDDQPYATPVNFVYVEEDQALYFHGAHTGRTRANIKLNTRVCFNVSEMGELETGKRSSDFGVKYRSVTIFGTAEKVTKEGKHLEILLALMTKYFPDHTPGEDYPIPETDERKRTAVFKIAIEEWSAKELK